MQPISNFNKNQSNSLDSSRVQEISYHLEEQSVRQTFRGSKCLFEDGDHRVYIFEKFKNFFVKQLKDAIFQLNACFNCLLIGRLFQIGHSSKECPSTQSYWSCNKHNHTNLHDESSQSADNTLQYHCIIWTSITCSDTSRNTLKGR